MRRLAAFLIVLAALGVAADFGLRLVAQNVAARALGSRRGVDGSVDVSFGGWPFVLHLLDRRFSSVVVSAEDVRGGDLGGSGGIAGTEARLESVVLRLRGVTIRGELWQDDPDRVVAAASGSGEASMTGAELNRLVPEEYAARLQLLDGRVRVTAATPAGEQSAEVADDLVRVEPGAASGTLVIDAPTPLRPVLIPLPELVAGTRFEGVEVLRGAITLTFTLTDVRLEL
jgi:hypothetical protein